MDTMKEEEVILCPPVTGKTGACVAGRGRRIRNLWTEQSTTVFVGPGLKAKEGTLLGRSCGHQRCALGRESGQVRERALYTREHSRSGGRCPVAADVVSLTLARGIRSPPVPCPCPSPGSVSPVGGGDRGSGGALRRRRASTRYAPAFPSPSRPAARNRAASNLYPDLTELQLSAYGAH